MKTLLTLALAALCAAPLAAQTRIHEHAPKTFAEILPEAMTIRTKYAQILADIDAKRITPQYAAPDIVRLARRLNFLNRHEQRLIEQMTREERRTLRQTIRNHAQFSQSLERGRKSMDYLRDRLQRINYHDSIKLKEACLYFDRINKESYISL